MRFGSYVNSFSSCISKASYEILALAALAVFPRAALRAENASQSPGTQPAVHVLIRSRGYGSRVRTVLYLHGFASSPEGRKVTLLREVLEPEGYRVVAPDLNRPSFGKLDFDAMVAEAVRAAVAERPSVAVGSSLGALVALAAAKQGGLAAPLILVAPALGFGRRWIENAAPGDPVRFYHYGQGRDLEVHRYFFQQMADNTVDRQPPPQRVIVVMGEEDESVPFAGVEQSWKRWEADGRLAAGSRFLPIPGGDHGLIASVDTIAGLIRTV